MRPEAVLDPREKQVHFHKYHKKQERLSKVKKNKSLKKDEVKLSRSRDDAKQRSPHQTKQKIVKNEQRTPDRQDLDSDVIFPNQSYRSTDMVQTQTNPEAFNSYVPSFRDSTWSYGHRSTTCPIPQEEYGQSIPDLDDIRTEALFFWNPMNFL
jgi:hypothetical protein